jgi:hypothetical protein
LGKAQIHSLNEVLEDSQLNPFARSAQENTALLTQQLHQPALREEIEADLGINLTDVPLRSQIHLLRFLAGQNRAGFDRLRNVLKSHPESSNKILNSFLAVAEDMRYSESILKLAETLDSKTAEAVFSKYAEIVKGTEQIRQLTPEQTNEIIKNLLHRGNELLRAWAQAAETQEASAILEQLEHIKAEILLFASTFKVLSAHEQVELTDLSGVKFEIKLATELSETERRQMQRIFAENRRGYSPSLFKETVQEFNEALNSVGQEFQILRLNDEVIAFIRFHSLPNGKLYAGSLNVRPEVKGSAMLQAALDQKARSYEIEAVAYSQNPMLSKYTSDFGFRIAGEIPDYQGTGELFYKLFRPKAEPSPS